MHKIGNMVTIFILLLVPSSPICLFLPMVSIVLKSVFIIVSICIPGKYRCIVRILKEHICVIVITVKYRNLQIYIFFCCLKCIKRLYFLWSSGNSKNLISLIHLYCWVCCNLHILTTVYFIIWTDLFINSLHSWHIGGFRVLAFLCFDAMTFLSMSPNSSSWTWARISHVYIKVQLHDQGMWKFKYILKRLHQFTFTLGTDIRSISFQLWYCQAF